MDFSTIMRFRFWLCWICMRLLSMRADFEFAVRLAERAIELFEDRENGGFFSTAEPARRIWCCD